MEIEGEVIAKSGFQNFGSIAVPMLLYKWKRAGQISV